MDDKWKSYPPKTYQKETESLVHFNSKTVNSNASLVGIRLGADAAVDLPYISLRTLLGSGLSFPLDYAEGGASKAGIVKQINQVLADSPDAAGATAEEKKAIVAGVNAANASGYSTGTEYVDHRLRQVLVPKKDAPGGYVSMTPITASSICPLFFTKEHGLVPRHNEAAKAEPEGPRRKLRQAQFGIGGSNPQNIGSLVSFIMQRPLMVAAPGASASTRDAFSLYHKGLALNVHTPELFRQAVQQYVHFRESMLNPHSDDAAITLKEREQEEALITAIAQAVLDMAADARELLTQHAHLLPEEDLLHELDPPRHALVSPLLRPAEMRGLLDPPLRERCDNWPRSMARLVVTKMLAPHKSSGRSLLKLDSSARASLESMMEEAFR
jgi:hypothetical protein